MPEFSRMAKYQGSVEYRRIDGVTIAASFATVEIRDSGGVGVKIIYSDEAGAPHANPFQLDANGWGEFYVRPDDAEFDMVVQAPAGEFATFTQSALRASLSGRKKFYVRDYADFLAARADLILIGHGGTIVFERDIANLPQLSLAGIDNVVLEGIHPDVTLTAQANIGSSLIESSNNTRCQIRNLRVDGNLLNQVAANVNCVGISIFNSIDQVVENVQITNCMSDGMVITSAVDARIKNVKSFENYGHGFSHGGGAPRGNRIYFTDCRAITNGHQAYAVHGHPWPRNTGFDFEPPPDGLIMRGCHAEDNSEVGILSGSENAAGIYQRIQLTNCSTKANGTEVALGGGIIFFIIDGHAAGIDYDDILIEGGIVEDEKEFGIKFIGGNDISGDHRIMNVRVIGPVIRRSQNYGLNVWANCQDVRIEGAQIYNNGLGFPGVGVGWGAYCQGGAAGREVVRASFDGCDVYDKQAVPTQQNGIVIGGATEDCRIADCTAWGNVVLNYEYANAVNLMWHNNHSR